ncbi:DUF3108 domain-containing protein [candidate division KSB1 bacterium]|nr:DUF3108 domain-containing protein [candidate division KSB1 bacterium]
MTEGRKDKGTGRSCRSSISGMNRHPRLYFWAFIFLLILNFRFQSIAFAQSDVWRKGEELVYKVNWSFIRLGTLRLKVADKLKIEGRDAYRVILSIDSNPLLFFLNVHFNTESIIDEDYFSHYFMINEIIGGEKVRTEYWFDYDQKKIIIKGAKVGSCTESANSEMSLLAKIQDGTSIVYFARGNIYQNKKIRIPVMIETEIEYIDFVFNNKRRLLEIDAIGRSVEVVGLEGKAGFKGIAGFTGEFQGWFSTDGRAVPLRAKMKVFIGKVTVELERWNK